MPQKPGPVFDGCPEFFGTFGAPKSRPPESGFALCRKGFAALYDPVTRNPRWVIEILSPDRLSGSLSRKGLSFRPDPGLGRQVQAGLSDFRGSGYDRGHLIPAADLKWNREVLKESFYFSNISPQIGPGFNRGIWRRLEAEIRRRARKTGTLFVFTGPVFYDYEPVIGAGRVVVPDAFFKIVFDPEKPAAMAFLLQNRRHDKTPLGNFQVTVDRIEDLTGLDFFPVLPKALEESLEKILIPWPGPAAALGVKQAQGKNRNRQQDHDSKE